MSPWSTCWRRTSSSCASRARSGRSRASGRATRWRNRPDTSLGFVLTQGRSINVPDYRRETRFAVPPAYLDAGLTSAPGGPAVGPRPDHRRARGPLARAPCLRRRRGAIPRIARQSSRQQPAAGAIGGGPEPRTAARKRRPADRRHRPRLQQPADDHPGQPAGARGASRRSPATRTASNSWAPRRVPPGAAPS